MDRNLETAKRYLSAIEQGIACKQMAEFFSPEVIQEKFPNRLVPIGAKRDLAAFLMDVSAARKSYLHSNMRSRTRWPVQT